MTGIRNKDGMFPLGREAMVSSDDSPVIRHEFYFFATRINHGFNSKSHTRPQPFFGARGTVVQNLRVLVKLATNTMTAVFPNHRTMVAFGVLLDRMAYITKVCAWLNHFYAHFHTLITNASNTLCLDVLYFINRASRGLVG